MTWAGGASVLAKSSYISAGHSWIVEHLSYSWLALPWSFLALPLSVMRLMKELHDRFTRERIQAVNENDATSATPHFTSVSLSGVRFGVNTAEDGTLPVRITGAGPFTVSLYKAAW